MNLSSTFVATDPSGLTPASRLEYAEIQQENGLLKKFLIEKIVTDEEGSGRRTDVMTSYNNFVKQLTLTTPPVRFSNDSI